MNDSHEQIMRVLGNLEGKVDGINQRLDTLNGSQRKQDEKIDALEKWQDQLTGKIAVGATIFGIFGSFITSVLWKKFNG